MKTYLFPGERVDQNAVERLASDMSCYHSVLSANLKFPLLMERYEKTDTKDSAGTQIS